jgi:non-ribosomal peptide synthetase component E (peptide arylation enzyme)
VSSATHSREAAPALDSVVAAAFASRVDRDPKHVAVRTNEHEVTFAALDRRANVVAACLIEGSGRGSGPVPLLVLEAAPMLAAELGILSVRPRTSSTPRAGSPEVRVSRVVSARS